MTSTCIANLPWISSSASTVYVDVTAGANYASRSRVHERTPVSNRALARLIGGAVVAVALVAVAVVVGTIRTQRATTRRRHRLTEDCAIDECGADGLPLNAYSG
jgi:hypothetical protein